jgi:hypothetical protein
MKKIIKRKRLKVKNLNDLGVGAIFCFVKDNQTDIGSLIKNGEVFRKLENGLINKEKVFTENMVLRLDDKFEFVKRTGNFKVVLLDYDVEENVDTLVSDILLEEIELGYNFNINGKEYLKVSCSTDPKGTYIVDEDMIIIKVDEKTNVDSALNVNLIINL